MPTITQNSSTFQGLLKYFSLVFKDKEIMKNTDKISTLEMLDTDNGRN